MVTNAMNHTNFGAYWRRGLASAKSQIWAFTIVEATTAFKTLPCAIRWHVAKKVFGTVRQPGILMRL